MASINILGLMSGTSLDGLDLCLVKFTDQNESLEFDIRATKTVKYTREWTEKLKVATTLSTEQLLELDFDFGELIGHEVNNFLKESKEDIHFVASHGHTVFHQPEKGYTLQIGNGFAIHNTTNYPVIFDFRSLDVALGGQGAPLVPIGDKMLFSDYTACINFGGIANISFEAEGKRIAFDICPVNMALNELASELNVAFDNGGELAKKGSVIPDLLAAMNQLDYYRLTGPKSLGIEWYNAYFKPLIDNSTYPVHDKLRTVVEHIAIQVSESIKAIPKGDVLVTGGGAYNTFLVERIRDKSHHNIIVPDGEQVEFKEALIFALLGYLKFKGQTNVLKSVTGAKKDSSSGILVGFAR